MRAGTRGPVGWNLPRSPAVQLPATTAQYKSTLAVGVAGGYTFVWPPATSTRPSCKRVAVGPERSEDIGFAAGWNVPSPAVHGPPMAEQ